MSTISTNRYEKQFIRDQVERIDARRLLEVGAFKGLTTRVMSAAAGAEGSVVVIDPMRWASRPCNLWEWIDGLLHPFSYERAFRANVRRSGHDNVSLFRRLSTDPDLIADPDPLLAEFDLAFIDGEHTYEGVAHDMAHWGVRVRPGGIVLLHDCVPRFPGVCRLVSELEADRRFRVTRPARRCTIAVVEVMDAVSPGPSGNGARP